MLSGQRYSFTERFDALGRSVIMPYIPLTISLGDRSVEVTALLDSGASVNVIPYSIGLELGAVWTDLTLSIPLAGNLAKSDARALLLSTAVAHFPPVDLGFAWSERSDVPVILGHMKILRPSAKNIISGEGRIYLSIQVGYLKN